MSLVGSVTPTVASVTPTAGNVVRAVGSETSLLSILQCKMIRINLAINAHGSLDDGILNSNTQLEKYCTEI